MEEPLIDYGACLLGSINLSEFVRDDGSFDYTYFTQTVELGVRYLNDVLDQGAMWHPLEQQRVVALEWRQIGLGVMGLADMLIKMGIRYGSTKSLELCEDIAQCMINTALKASANLAAECGAYPKYDADTVLYSDFILCHAESDTMKLIGKYGLANSQLLTIPPCGSIGTMLGVSSGMEPVFANYYTRKTESLKGEDAYYKVYTPIVREYMEKHGLKDDSELPDYFVTAHDLSWKERVDMQAIWQNYIDASISSTCNLPEDATVEDVEQLYMYAWQRGLKGITVFRNNCKRAGVLTTGNAKSADESQNERFDHITPVPRSEFGTTHGSTYLKRCACGKLYITVNRDSSGNIVETFVNTSKGGICQANSNAVNRLISMSMRSGVKIDEIVEQLRGINCPACVRASGKGASLDGLSCPDIIARVIKEFYDEHSGEVKQESPAPKIEPVAKPAEPDENHCPDCGNVLSHQGGCNICENCGWNKCEG